MHATLPKTLLSALLSLGASSVVASSWNLSTTYGPNDFFTGFTWFTDKDPTNGLVLYQSMANARSSNLSTVSNDQFVMAVETTEVALEGRKSVRITSNEAYSDGIYVLNAAHVPTGCATWPAFWTVTTDLDTWPVGGEIDIAENANDQYPAPLSSLHTQSNCIIAKDISTQSGTVQYTNCSAYTSDNSGCRIELETSSSDPSWGTPLNTKGGGTYAMERSLGSTGNGIRVWFWANGSEPSDLKAGSQSVDPSTWGTPDAHFDVADNCHTDFGPHNIIFDITLCGDWAANTYESSGCTNQYPACSFQVGYNGSSFNQSYWSIYDLRVFAAGGGTDNAANSPNTAKESGNTVSGASSLVMSMPFASLCTIAVAALALFTLA